MASIAGIQVKGVKTYSGMEGFAEQGNLYMDGKKIGFWSQDADGGDDRYEFDKPESEQLFYNRIKDYFRKNPPIDESRLYSVNAEDVDMGHLPQADVNKDDIATNPDCFMYNLSNLIDVEKTWKKAVKTGFAAIGIVKYYDTLSPTPVDETWNIRDDDIELSTINILDKAQKKNPTAHITVYAEAKDFILS